VKAGNIVTSSVTREIFDNALGCVVSAQIHERLSLTVGDRVSGPAVVVEAETATLITSSYVATVQADRSLLLETRTS
jgi:N-methylhydantoinase A